MNLFFNEFEMGEDLWEHGVQVEQRVKRETGFGRGFRINRVS